MIKEKCMLVGVSLPHNDKWEIDDHLKELDLLADTAGAEIVDKIIQERDRFNSAFYIGKGKAEELALRVEMEDISTIIFDDDLSPAQVRNLENLTKAKVIDRSGLILDIFAAHARTKESRTQVELAQLNYLLPRLTRQWLHLSRQVGGIGTKGPGETQLETDRRLVRTRIAHLKRELQRMEKQKLTQRKQQQSMFRIAIVGYTNAGKSTILNTLTEGDVLVENKLFATLDTTTKRMELEHGINALISDTVGFIRKLPHDLVASFKSTLSQTVESDLLLHVVDISHPHFEQHINVVKQIMSEMNILHKKSLLVFNKIDILKDASALIELKKKFPDAIFVSAKTGLRLTKIKEKIFDIIREQYLEKQIVLPYDETYKLNQISMFAKILSQKFEEKFIQVNVLLKKENEQKFDAYIEKKNVS